MPKLTQSYVRGADDEPLISDTIGNYFDSTAKRQSERLALVVRHQGVRWTYAELKQRVDDFAAGLLALGLEPGDRIGIWSPNNAEWTITQYATAKAGLIQVNLNTAYRATELEYALNKAGCKALITADAFKSNDYLATLRSLAPEIAASASGDLQAERLTALKTLIHIGEGKDRGFFRFSDVLSIARPADRVQLTELASRVQPSDPASIMFTSGTTGAPKGATLSHAALLNSAVFVGRSLGVTADDRICVPVPLFHVFGMIGGNLLAMVHGAATVFPDESFDPGAVLEAVTAEGCTVLHGVPTMFMAELNHPNFASYDLTSLRTGIIAGAPCPAEVLGNVIAKMHMREVSNLYAMTEAVTCTQTSPGDPLERRLTTVGRVAPHIEVKTIDGESGIAPLGLEGELCIRGYSVMRGYWEDKERTAQAIDPDGWMHTGDLATLDEQGYCRIVGRIKDIVIRGGEKIWPREIEEFLLRHPKIVDAQLFGVPDEKYGEELCAWVKLKSGESAAEEEIRAFCKGQIAHYKVPRYIRFVEAFPMTASGKAQKFLMREQMVKELGLTAVKTT